LAAASLLAGVEGAALLQSKVPVRRASGFWVTGSAAVLFVASAGTKLAVPASGADPLFWLLILAALAALLILVSSLAGAKPIAGSQAALSAVVALLVLAGFAWVYYSMLQQTGASETVWARSVYLYAGIEAMAFGAAGFFFGKEVTRGQVPANVARFVAAIKAKGDAYNTPTIKALPAQDQIALAQEYWQQLAEEADRLFG
jgi:hypothetical protein